MRNKKPKIIFVLSGGSARGLAHIGFLEILEKENIKPDAIVGTSMGALIGGLYAAGVNPKKIEKTALKIGKLEKIFLFASVPHKSGFIRGGKIEKLIKEFIGNKKIENLDIPFYAVAADLVKEEKIVINKGSLFQAIRASIAIPGVFTPVKIGNKILIDGGVFDPLPIDIALDLGAKLIIASDVNSLHKKNSISSNPNIITILSSSLHIMMGLLLKYSSIENDKILIIKSKLQNIGLMDYGKTNQIIELGRIAARKRINEIKKRLE